MKKSDSRTVDHQYFIRVSPKRAFEAISESRWLVRWLADTAEIAPRKGGQYTLGWNGGPTHHGRVAEFVRGKRISLAWSWPGVKLTGTRFQLSVQPKGKGSIVAVRHTGFPRKERWVDLYAGAEWGWTYFLMNLKSVLEHGEDLRSQYDG